ncbi:hypothetical protein ScPMuIL_010474 [Solemya velum]
MFITWYEKVNGTFGTWLFKYGNFVARHPSKLIVMACLVNLLLGIGLIRLDILTDPFYLYTPEGNRAKKDQTALLDLHPDYSKTNYYSHSLISFGRFGEVLVRAKDGENILTESGLNEVDRFFHYVLNQTTVTDENGTVWTYDDLCARQEGSCVIDGKELLDNREKLYKGEVTYPQFIQDFTPVFLPIFLGKASTVNGYVVAAKDIRFRINIVDDKLGVAWEQEFKKTAEDFVSDEVDTFYTYSIAIVDEANMTIERNVVFFAGSLALMIIFASIVTMGGTCLSNRSLLAQSGVVSSILGVVGSFGLLSAAGVGFVNIAGVAPFLVLGIGLNNMFIMLSGLADAIPIPSVEHRIGETMRTSGLSISITSAAIILAFILGATATYPGIRMFCIYTAGAVFFTYMNFLTIFPASMALHEFWMEKHRQPWLSMVSRETGGGAPIRSTFCCSGTSPESREDVDSPLQKFIVFAAQKILRQGWCRPLIILLYIVYLGVTIWGTLHFKAGVLIQQVSHEDSTFYKHSLIVLADYKLEMLVSYNIMDPLDYSSPSVQADMDDLIKNAKADYFVRNDFHVSWLDAYKQSDNYDDSSEIAFVTNLKRFLDRHGFFRNDVIFNEDVTKIIASRFYVRAEGTSDWIALTDLMAVERKYSIATAFLQAEGKTRKDKVEAAIEMTGAPMCNGAFLTFVGVVLLTVSESYIFFTFFRIISIIVILGATHTLVILPIVLLVMGPFEDPEIPNKSQSMEMIAQSPGVELSNKSESVFNGNLFSRQLSNTSAFSIPRARINSDTSNEPGMPEVSSYYC